MATVRIGVFPNLASTTWRPRGTDTVRKPRPGSVRVAALRPSTVTTHPENACDERLITASASTSTLKTMCAAVMRSVVTDALPDMTCQSLMPCFPVATRRAPRRR